MCSGNGNGSGGSLSPTDYFCSGINFFDIHNIEYFTFYFIYSTGPIGTSQFNIKI
jgi:hypothetical protein